MAARPRWPSYANDTRVHIVNPYKARVTVGLAQAQHVTMDDQNTWWITPTCLGEQAAWPTADEAIAYLIGPPC